MLPYAPLKLSSVYSDQQRNLGASRDGGIDCRRLKPLTVVDDVSIIRKRQKREGEVRIMDGGMANVSPASASQMDPETV